MFIYMDWISKMSWSAISPRRLNMNMPFDFWLSRQHHPQIWLTFCWAHAVTELYQFNYCVNNTEMLLGSLFNQPSTISCHAKQNFIIRWVSFHIDFYCFISWCLTCIFIWRKHQRAAHFLDEHPFQLRIGTPVKLSCDCGLDSVCKPQFSFSICIFIQVRMPFCRVDSFHMLQNAYRKCNHVKWYSRDSSISNAMRGQPMNNEIFYMVLGAWFSAQISQATSDGDVKTCWICICWIRYVVGYHRHSTDNALH